MNIGDHIQWENNGMLMFKVLPKITGFSPCKRYVFVNENRTGIPVNEIVEVKKPGLLSWNNYVRQSKKN